MNTVNELFQVLTLFFAIIVALFGVVIIYIRDVYKCMDKNMRLLGEVSKKDLDYDRLIDESFIEIKESLSKINESIHRLESRSPRYTTRDDKGSTQ